MKTERQRDPERTRRRILDAATAELAAKGYAGARVGELDPDLDPACVAVVLFAATLAPTVLPQIVGSIYQADPTTEEFTATFAEQLSDVLRHLRLRT